MLQQRDTALIVDAYDTRVAEKSRHYSHWGCTCRGVDGRSTLHRCDILARHPGVPCWNGCRRYGVHVEKRMRATLTDRRCSPDLHVKSVAKAVEDHVSNRQEERDDHRANDEREKDDQQGFEQ